MVLENLAQVSPKWFTLWCVFQTADKVVVPTDAGPGSGRQTGSQQEVAQPKSGAPMVTVQELNPHDIVGEYTVNRLFWKGANSFRATERDLAVWLIDAILDRYGWVLMQD